MIELISLDGRKTNYNGKSMLIFTALYRIYEDELTNIAKLNGRIVRFSNCGWTYEDEIPFQIKDELLARYEKDAQRLAKSKS